MGRRGRHTVPHSEREQGTGRARPSRPDRPRNLSCRGKTRPLRPGRTHHLAGHGHGDHRGKRQGQRRAHPARQGVFRRSRAAHHGNLPSGTRACRPRALQRRTLRRLRSHAAFRLPARSRTHPRTPQDRHHAAPSGQLHRLRRHGGPVRRQSAAGLQLQRSRPGAAAGALLRHLDQRAYARHHPLGSRPLSALHRRHHGRGRTLLPLGGGQGRQIPRKGTSSCVHRTRRPESGRILRQRHFHQPAAGHSGKDGELHPRS